MKTNLFTLFLILTGITITTLEIKSYANDVCYGPAVPDTVLCKFSSN